MITFKRNLGIRTAARMLAVLATLALAIWLAPASHATNLAAGDRQSFQASGRIESVDYQANIIVVRSHQESLSITLTPTTTVERQGQLASISDLRQGDRVRVSGVIRDGTMIAVSIVIRS